MTPAASLPTRLATAADAQANILTTPGMIVACYTTRQTLGFVPDLLRQAEQRIRELEAELRAERSRASRIVAGVRRIFA